MNANKLFSTLLDTLNPRQKEVVSGRFGLDKYNEPQTLAAIGDKFGITRERVRQIEAVGLEILGEKINSNPQTLDIIERSKKYLKSMGGLAKKDDFLEHHRDYISGLNENHIGLLLESSGAFNHYLEDEDFVHFYYLDKEVFKSALNFINSWVNFLRARKELVLAGKYRDHFIKFLTEKEIDKNHAENYLGVSKKVMEGPYGDIGLSEWPEINPKTIREHVYLVLRKKKQPLHFENISDEISKMRDGEDKSSVPTVHNELIKDDRFVLVGRGMYGLKEHGFEHGTAREVINRILKRNGPMKPREVILAVQKERFFKPNTVLVNLQNKNFFERLKDGTYKVRKT
jgi:hypothetical protein